MIRQLNGQNRNLGLGQRFVMLFIYFYLFKSLKSLECGPGSSVGIATAYGLDGSGIESRRRRDFPHLSRPALRPTQPSVKLVPGLSRG